ncbi:DUF885 domain-containing protein [Streptomyces xanthochromogenes]|uniref:DUF885 domain-containing protein n=1 Tax=Streptomyces xanthochromogenes TaxID=67384 RepID=UPI00343F9992
MSDTLEEIPGPLRTIADAYVDALIELDPVTGTQLGVADSARRLPDFSPEGRDRLAALARATLLDLDAALRAEGSHSDAERRCARLLRERLGAELGLHEAGEGLRDVSNFDSPPHTVREVFLLMPTGTRQDWEAVAERLRAVPAAFDGWRASLTEGLARGLPAGPRQVATVIAQLDAWTGSGEGWFAEFAAPGLRHAPRALRGGAARADRSLGELRDWLRHTYAPAVAHAPDTVGRERYARFARLWTGMDLDLDEAYAYGWSEYHRLAAEMRREAAKITPGARDPWAVLGRLADHGRAVEGAEQARAWLQSLMDDAIDRLDTTHFDLSGPLRRVESCLAPAGSAAAPYYTPPSLDFSRPGRTWLPTMGRTRFPAYDLVSTWYHEGVPGHHLQLAQWVRVADRLSRYQTTVGLVSANLEGWALYAERLMDELGFLTDPELRLGHLDAQMLRAVRVIVDIGMHLGLAMPADAPQGPRTSWTPELAQRFLRAHSGRPEEFVESEIVRYLGLPGQAIGYKLGERAWLTGRAAARAAHGDAFDLKAWHMAALSLGSLGLDDLVAELSRL